MNSIEPKLEIFGSYEKSLTESKIIVGHDKIKYVVGGNARYTTRSNIIDWNLVKSENIGDSQIKTINNILQFPEYIDDRETLYKLLHQINKLKTSDFLKLLENSLNLKESIMIQLRRLFYIVDKINGVPGYIKPTGFCPYVPVQRIEILLAENAEVKLDYTALYKTIHPFVIQYISLIKKKSTLFNSKLQSVESKSQYNKINIEMNKFVSLYTSAYDTLHAIENVNVEIAQCFEKICDSFDIVLD
jgi:hypothetical protein